jgi:hypothetical protein
VFLQIGFLSSFTIMNLLPISCNRALRLASGACSRPLLRIDLEILSCFYGAKKWVTINYLHREFNPRSKPSYDDWNDRYYRAIERLLSQGLVEQSISPKGWRRWQITIAGRLEIDKLNKAALEILKKWAEEEE